MEARPVVLITTYPGRLDEAKARAVSWWTRAGPGEYIVTMERSCPVLEGIAKVWSFGLNHLDAQYVEGVAELFEPADVNDTEFTWKRGKSAPLIRQAYRTTECKVRNIYGNGNWMIVVAKAVADISEGCGECILIRGNEFVKTGGVIWK